MAPVRTAMERRQLPPIERHIVTQDVEIALRVLHVEVAVTGPEPPVDNFDDLDLAIKNSPHSIRLQIAVLRCRFGMSRTEG